MKIIIAEDDKDLSSTLSIRLIENGYLVFCYNSKDDFQKKYMGDADLYIIDLNLGNNENEGFEIIEWLRKNKKDTNPIMILSGYSNIEKRVYGLNIGADDFLVKPFIPEELDAKIKVMFRRISEEKSNIIAYKNHSFDLNTRKFLNCNFEFTKKETMIIELFLLNKNKVIPKTKISTSIWGDYSGIGVSDNTMNVTFFHLRKKIGDFFKLETVIGEGYILKE